MSALMKKLKRAVWEENEATLSVLEMIAELDKRRDYLREGYSSLYGYLTRGLKFSEGAANRRIRAARLMVKAPQAKELFRKRKVSLCTLSLILDKPELLEDISGKSKREAEEVVALKSGKDLVPQERVVPVAVRKVVPEIPKSTATSVSIEKREIQLSSPPPAAEVQKTVIEERLKLSFSIERKHQGLIDEVRELTSGKYPKGASLEELFLDGLRMIRESAEKKRKRLGTRKSRVVTNKRTISAKDKKVVLERDGHQCSYRHQDGSVCGSKWQLEFDHVKPFALGGESSADNIRVLCRAHNQLLAVDAGLNREEKTADCIHS